MGLTGEEAREDADDKRRWIVGKMGRPMKDGGRFRHLSVNIEPEMYAEIEAAARADERAISAFGRMLVNAAWRIYLQKGDAANEWLRKHGRTGLEAKAARTA